jgi:hypothetical protein
MGLSGLITAQASEYTSFHDRPTCDCSHRFNGPSKSENHLRRVCRAIMDSNRGDSSNGGFERGRDFAQRRP